MEPSKNESQYIMKRDDPSPTIIRKTTVQREKKRTRYVIPKIAFISHSVIEEIKLKGNIAELTKGSCEDSGSRFKNQIEWCLSSTTKP